MQAIVKNAVRYEATVALREIGVDDIGTALRTAENLGSYGVEADGVGYEVTFDGERGYGVYRLA